MLTGNGMPICFQIFSHLEEVRKRQHIHALPHERSANQEPNYLTQTVKQ
jgi:hypothetical protein